MTITLHLHDLWALLGKGMATCVAIYVLGFVWIMAGFDYVSAATYVARVVVLALLAALIYGVWFA